MSLSIRLFKQILIILFIMTLFNCSGKNGFEDTDPEFHYQLAMEYLKLGKPDEAVEELKNSINKDPKNIKAYQMLGITYSKAGNFSGALSAYKDILEVDPDNVTALNLLGVMYSQGGKYDDAAVYFEKAIKGTPGNSFTYNNYALSLAGAGETDLAIEMYDKALEINPKFERAYNNKSRAYMTKKEYDKAIEILQKILKLNPSSQMAISNMGAAYEEKGEHDKAIEYLKQAIELNPKRFSDHLQLAAIYTKKGEFEKAEAAYRFAISEKPDFSLAYNGLGYLYAQKGEKGKLDYAEELINKAIGMDPSHKDSFMDSLSWIYYKKGDYKGALKYALEGEAIVNKKAGKLSYETKYHTGMIYLKLGEKAKAAAYLNEYKKTEEKRLRKRVVEYGQYKVDRKGEDAYKYESVELRKKMPIRKYLERHFANLDAKFIKSFLVKYEVGKIKINEDMKTADVEIIISKAVTGVPIPKTRYMPPEKSSIEKWENQMGVWVRGFNPLDVKRVHISGAFGKG